MSAVLIIGASQQGSNPNKSAEKTFTDFHSLPKQRGLGTVCFTGTSPAPDTYQRLSWHMDAGGLLQKTLMMGKKETFSSRPAKLK